MFYVRICVVVLLVFSEFSASPASAGTSADKKTANQCTDPFTYDYGPSGQPNWCGACNAPTSMRQAPINISNTRESAQPLIQFNNYNAKTSLVIYPNNPYNLKIDYKDSNNPVGTITIGNDTFKLQEFHFHRPSEEAIENRRFPMVLHLVHLKDQPGCALGNPGCVAVITVLIKQGKPEDNTSALLDILFNHFPPPTGNQNVQISLEGLIPAEYNSAEGNKGYWRYDGSLTTPPCTENVSFYVLKAMLTFSPEQLAEFERRYPMPNARDIQPLNGREILNRAR
jgi:carbonic anhydrase